MYTEVSKAHATCGCWFAADCQTAVTTTAQEALAVSHDPASEDDVCCGHACTKLAVYTLHDAPVQNSSVGAQEVSRQ